jgi:hypothetical protein
LDTGALGVEAATGAGVLLTAWGGGAECVVVAGVLLSVVVVCEGVVAVDDDDDESCLSCLKIFLSLSIVF